MALVRRNRIEGCREAIRADVSALIDSFVADGQCDFQKQFTDVITIRVLNRLLALPPSAEAIIKRLVRLIAATDVEPGITPEQLAERSDAFHTLFGFNRELLEECARHPGDDYVSELVKMQIERDGALDVNTLSILLFAIQMGGDHAVASHLAHLAMRLGEEPGCSSDCARTAR